MAKNDFIVNGQMPAFPSEGVHQFAPTGLTKREHFAAMAMQGILASSYGLNIVNVANSSIQMADELLKQLES